jgi:hypothetical protein
MISLFDKLKFSTVAIAMVLGACGGGDADTNTAVAPSPAPEVFITMVRNVVYGEFRDNVRILDDDATTVIVAVANADIRVRAIRCASLSPPVGVATVAAQSLVVFMDVAVADVEKLKAFKFLVFSTVQQPGRIFEESCAYVKSPVYL